MLRALGAQRLRNDRESDQVALAPHEQRKTYSECVIDSNEL